MEAAKRVGQEEGGPVWKGVSEEGGRNRKVPFCLSGQEVRHIKYLPREF